MTPWQWASASHLSVQREADGGWESRSVADPEVAAWIAAGGQPEPEVAAPEPTQRELDLARYASRAEVKDRLIAEMAADNMARVRSGEWVVADLVELMSDPAVKTIMEQIGFLSFELAAQTLAAIDHPLLTPDIRAGWVARLQSHFYLSQGS